jgi:hypothetical protein
LLQAKPTKPHRAAEGAQSHPKGGNQRAVPRHSWLSLSHFLRRMPLMPSVSASLIPGVNRFRRTPASPFRFAKRNLLSISSS